MNLYSACIQTMFCSKALKVYTQSRSDVQSEQSQTKSSDLDLTLGQTQGHAHDPAQGQAPSQKQVQDKLEQIIESVGQAASGKTVVEPDSPAPTPWTPAQLIDQPTTPVTIVPDPDNEFYPVDRIVRGKHSSEGLKYLVKWKGYSSRHNTWERASDLSPETLQYLKEHPVRIFGRKPVDNPAQVTTDPPTLDPNTMTDDQLQEAYDAETIIDSDEEVGEID